PLREVDLRTLDAAAQAAEVRARLDPPAWEPPAIEDRPAWRAVLLWLSDTHALLLLGLPALYADAATMVNLVGEISAAYAGTAMEEPLQYADIAEVFNTLLESDETEA